MNKSEIKGLKSIYKWFQQNMGFEDWEIFIYDYFDSYQTSSGVIKEPNSKIFMYKKFENGFIQKLELPCQYKSGRHIVRNQFGSRIDYQLNSIPDEIKDAFHHLPPPSGLGTYALGSGLDNHHNSDEISVRKVSDFENHKEELQKYIDSAKTWFDCKSVQELYLLYEGLDIDSFFGLAPSRLLLKALVKAPDFHYYHNWIQSEKDFQHFLNIETLRFIENYKVNLNDKSRKRIIAQAKFALEGSTKRLQGFQSSYDILLYLFEKEEALYPVTKFISGPYSPLRETVLRNHIKDELLNIKFTTNNLINLEDKGAKEELSTQELDFIGQYKYHLEHRKYKIKFYETYLIKWQNGELIKNGSHLINS